MKKLRSLLKRTPFLVKVAAIVSLVLPGLLWIGTVIEREIRHRRMETEVETEKYWQPHLKQLAQELLSDDVKAERVGSVRKGKMIVIDGRGDRPYLAFTFFKLPDKMRATTADEVETVVIR